MKLALFNLREDERPFVDAWLKEHPEVEVDLHEGELQAETKHLLEGKQGAVMFQNRPFAKEFIIHHVSIFFCSRNMKCNYVRLS